MAYAINSINKFNSNYTFNDILNDTIVQGVPKDKVVTPTYGLIAQRIYDIRPFKLILGEHIHNATAIATVNHSWIQSISSKI